MTKPEGERIAKRLARAGLCSRREAEAWILAGRVAVDGKVLDSPALTVTASSIVTVDGKPIPEAEPTRLWRYHKPAGLVTTNRDPQGRPTVFDKLPAEMPRVMTIGRLDLNSEGLLLLTNDGELARRLELPATAWVRRYRVRVHAQVDPKRLEALEDGIEIEGVRYGPIRAELDRQMPNNAWLTVSLSEGKNREVRRVCEHLGWPVLRLIRIAYGPFQLGNLEPGAVEEIKGRVLREQLGGGKSARQGRKPGDETPDGEAPAAQAGRVRASEPPARRIGRKTPPKSPARATPAAALPHRGGGSKPAHPARPARATDTPAQPDRRGRKSAEPRTAKPHSPAAEGRGRGTPPADGDRKPGPKGPSPDRRGKRKPKHAGRRRNP